MSQTADIMGTRNWFFVSLFGHCFLLGGLVDPSLSLPLTPSVVTHVGQRAVLPCSWKSRLDLSPPSCHVQWINPPQTVFESSGDESWQAAEFEGRMDVSEDKLGSGDCSLIISDVQIADTGRYESFMVVDGDRSKKTRVFIQSVKLSVLDHKSRQSRGPGEDLVLDLHTAKSLRVVYQDTNNSDWSVVWVRGEPGSDRLEKHPSSEQLTVKSLTRSDRGTYKVLDKHGLAVSTVQLSVDVNYKSASVQLPQVTDSPFPTGDAPKHTSSAPLLFLSALVSTFTILHFS